MENVEKLKDFGSMDDDKIMDVMESTNHHEINEMLMPEMGSEFVLEGKIYKVCWHTPGKRRFSAQFVKFVREEKKEEIA